MSVIETLTEGIRARSLANEGEALLGKWEKTGLLEGLDDVGRTNMSRLLENQAAQLLKETSLMSSGDVEGFASVAFPIVRRVFGNLLAQDLVSVQPMSLPSGLIFFLDFKFSAEGSSMPRLAQEQKTRPFTAVASLVSRSRVVLTLGNELSEKSFYSLNQGYASPTGSNAAGVDIAVFLSGTYGDAKTRRLVDSFTMCFVLIRSLRRVLLVLVRLMLWGPITSRSLNAAGSKLELG